METSTEALPHWQLTTIFASLEAPEFIAAFESLLDAIGRLADLYDRHQIRRQPPGPLEPAMVPAVEAILNASNAVYRDYEVVDAYLYAWTSTDATNSLAQMRSSELRARGVLLAQLGQRLTAWLGSIDVASLLAQSAVAHDHVHYIRQAVIAARHQMGETEEHLAAALSPGAGQAWAKLHDDVTARLSAPIEVQGQVRVLPMSVIRGLANDPDRSLRHRAYQAELATWPTVEVPLAAALNSIKWEVAELNRRRGWPDSIAPSLLANGIDTATLTAMQTAIVEAFPAFRRYLRAKARYLGQEQLAWWDLYAPVGQPSQRWSYPAMTTFIVEEFGRYSPRLAGLAQRAITEGWIDAEPRVGKVGGAFCMSVRRDESRILMNFEESFDSVSTLAHELGHAYHNFCLAERTPLQRATPMTLAETASIFCESLITNAELARSHGPERLSILEYSLQGACQVVVDIHSRFLFERSLFEERPVRELGPQELCAAMQAAQAQTYGDGLDRSTYHPYMWAVKGHYYSTDLSYYNYPYTFGHLFATGLLALYQRGQTGFEAAYNELLSSTGLIGTPELADRFGIDLTQIDFWRGGLSLIIDRIDQFERLVDSPRMVPWP